MNIVIPMAGLGTRFSQSGFALPKPLIEVNNKPMYRWAVDCLPLYLANKLIFILSDNEFSQTLKLDIQTQYGQTHDCAIEILTENTRGQAETVLKGSPLLNSYEPTLIHNCDTYFQENFSWENLLTKTLDGAIVLFNSTEPRWSYAQLDKSQNRIIAFKEKQVISSHASTGTYFFKDSKALINNIKKIITQDLRENNEYYLSTVYQLMLNEEKIILPLTTKKMLCFGTPADLVDSLNDMLRDK